ncbi:MAG: hypothetical protein IJ020_04255 [Bacteroidaceae bacterium]|nr:hypothetical protein [Bacteroidaceae bacterium]
MTLHARRSPSKTE